MKTLLKSLSLAVILSLGTAHANINEAQIRATLNGAGLSIPVESIQPSPISSLLLLSLGQGQEPLLITHDLNYVIQGNIEPNPSPKAATGNHPKAKAGTPITNAHKADLLANMTVLKNIDQQAAFYHTNVDGLLWGVSASGTPFLVSSDGRYFINGEISVIEDGLFAGLDTDFEYAKNRHALGQLDQETLAIYPAKGTERAVVYIATDINCPYCKIFHSKINEFNNKGITIKAIGYPVYDESPEPMRQIWCESDNTQRASLLSAAMRGIRTRATCQGDENNLTHNQLAAQSLAIFATPAIFNDQGELFQGDFNGKEFLEFLNIK